MAYNRPSLKQLISRVQSDIKSGTGIKTIFPRSFVGVISKAIAGVAHTLFGYISFIFKQLFPDTAELEYLARWASIWGVSRKDPSFCELTIQLSGTEGKVVPADTEMQSDTGLKYVVRDEGTIATGTVSLIIKCEVSGVQGNLPVDSNIKLISPILGITSEGSVLSVVTPGVDQESDDSLRARLIDKIQRPPSGGNANDYIQNCIEIDGVTRAWVFPEVNGKGTVGVKFVVDAEVDIVPVTQKITDVQVLMDIWRPITADLEVSAPSKLPLDMEIKITPNDAATQASCEAEIRDLIIRDANIAGAWSGPGSTFDGKILLSKIREALSIALGEDDHEITTILTVTPANVTPANSQLIVPGIITWSAL